MRMSAAERAAATFMERIGEAQRAFREQVGRRGYATDLASLMTPCPGDAQPLIARDPVAPAYVVVVRAAERATVTGADCHGRPIASDYYAAAQPATEVAGRQAFAMTARTRIHVFFDGLAPREADIGLAGLAVPLQAVKTFKIP